MHVTGWDSPESICAILIGSGNNGNQAQEKAGESNVERHTRAYCEYTSSGIKQGTDEPGINYQKVQQHLAETASEEIPEGYKKASVENGSYTGFQQPYLGIW